MPFLIDQFRISTNFNRLWVTFALSGWFEVPLSPAVRPSAVLASRSFAVRDSSTSHLCQRCIQKCWICWDSLGFFMVTDHLKGRERYCFHISSLYWLIFGLLLYGHFGEAAAQKPKMEVWCINMHPHLHSKKKGLKHIETTSGWNLMNQPLPGWYFGRAICNCTLHGLEG